MIYTYFMITNNCNLECAHCFRDSGPGKKDTTISYENFKRVINNIGKRTNLQITGGEIFTEKDKLYSFLEYIKNVNDEYKSGSGWDGEMFQVDLQTNGFWATSEEKIKNILSEIDALGVKGLDVTSDDEYHLNQGKIKRKNLEKLKSIFYRDKKSFMNLESFQLRGARVYVMPVGRGKDVWEPGKRLGFHSDCLKNISRNDLNINEKGEIFPCCWGAFPLRGNLIEQTLEKIVENSLKVPKLKALDEGGIKKLAIQDGWSKNGLDKQVEVLGECGFCYEYYIKTGRDKSITNENQ